MDFTQTIIAAATPPGRGGIAVVRISGAKTQALAAAMVSKPLSPRKATYCEFRGLQGEVIDQGIALFFPAPHSFTGEDVLELHGHGGPVVVDMLLQTGIALGARLARPGEFTERAFLNDKIDLTQAEAIADLIDSATKSAARAAMRSLRGEFSGRIHELVEALIELRMYVESAIDFIDEDIEFLSIPALQTRLEAVDRRFTDLFQSVHQGILLRDGLTVVLTGKPNTGKSSLLNRLTREETAIVTDIPGTTRDLIRAKIEIDGLPLYIIDTAGLRESDDRVEQQGIERAWKAISEADLIILLVDDRWGFNPDDDEYFARMPASVRKIIVRNKCDLSGTPEGIVPGTDPTQIVVSVLTGAGMVSLQQYIKQCFGFSSAEETTYIARRRHWEALRNAHAHVETGMKCLTDHKAVELCAEELRLAQRALNEITGEFSSDDLLGRIFSTFCIGK